MRSSAPELIQKAWRHVRNSYQNNPVAKEWVEGKVEAANTENKWEQKLGAVKAVIRGEVHAGGTDPTEPDHVTLDLEDGNGKVIKTVHVPMPQPPT